MRKDQSVVSRTGLGGLVVFVAMLVFTLTLGGCSSLGFYWQGFRGQVQIMHAAQPIPDWLQQEDLAPALRQRLQAAQKMREFASDTLQLPRNSSYTRYAALQRSHAVWNVVAAPADSLELHRWCFPIAGCVGYRGYFDPADARTQADELARQGLEVNVYGVPAYSTLGYLNWLGGDPLLSTFVNWQEGDFAGLLFHELAHQLLYVADDTAFNESFASTVEQIGTPLWLEGHASATTQKRWQQAQARRQQWQALTLQTRQALLNIYQQNKAQAIDAQALEAMKTEVFSSFRQKYALLRAQWLGQDQPLLTTPALRETYLQRLQQSDDWVRNANNASFGALAAYDDWVPAFTALWQQMQAQATSPEQGWQAFYAQVGRLAELPPEQRHEQLCQYLPRGTGKHLDC